jgi:hypothetical protein
MGEKHLSKMPARHFVHVGPPNISDKWWKNNAATEEVFLFI